MVLAEAAVASAAIAALDGMAASATAAAALLTGADKKELSTAIKGVVAAQKAAVEAAAVEATAVVGPHKHFSAPRHSIQPVDSRNKGVKRV